MILDLSHATEATAGPMIADFVGDLIYSSYAFNREQAPDVTPEQWREVFGAKADQMERRFQTEHSPRIILDEAATQEADLEADRRLDEGKLEPEGWPFK